jgi:hypothetical protein
MLKQFVTGLVLVVASALLSMSVAVAASAAEPGLMPQISEHQGIKVTVTPQAVSGESKIWIVEVTMETHTRSLGDDMGKAAVLVVDGKTYAPMSWEGSPSGGHHRKGLLRFNAIEPQPVQLELQLRLSVDAAPRSFKWPLK